MNKIITAIAICALSIGSAQAATYKWTVKNIHTCDPAATPITTGTAISSGSNYTIALFYSADTTISATFDGKSIAAGDDTLIGTFAPLGTGGLKSTGTDVAWDGYTEGTYYYAVLFNSKGTTSASAYDYYATSSVLTGDPTLVSPATPLKLTWANTVAAPTWTATQAAPEPTSGLLLLLGMAGLALKRKRA